MKEMVVTTGYIMAVVVFCAGILTMLSAKNETSLTFWMTLAAGTLMAAAGVLIFVASNAMREMDMEEDSK